MKKILLLVVALTLIAGSAFAGISGTKHDLSNAGSITTAGREICIWCHTPHGSASGAAMVAPLWSHSTTGQTFTMYGNPFGTINGTYSSGLSSTSLACMSCHDGVTGVGSVVYGKYANMNVIPQPKGGSVYASAQAPMPLISANLSNDLSNDHPVSITYNDTADTQLKARASITITPLYPSGGNVTVQCSSCHDVHYNTNFPFLQMSNNASALCLYCHNK